jgi:hypothetical protein
MSTHGNNEVQSSVTRAIRLEAGAIAEDSAEGGANIRAILARSSSES